MRLFLPPADGCSGCAPCENNCCCLALGFIFCGIERRECIPCDAFGFTTEPCKPCNCLYIGSASVGFGDIPQCLIDLAAGHGGMGNYEFYLDGVGGPPDRVVAASDGTACVGAHKVTFTREELAGGCTQAESCGLTFVARRVFLVAKAADGTVLATCVVCMDAVDIETVCSSSSSSSSLSSSSDSSSSLSSGSSSSSSSSYSSSSSSSAAPSSSSSSSSSTSSDSSDSSSSSSSGGGGGGSSSSSA